MAWRWPRAARIFSTLAANRPVRGLSRYPKNEELARVLPVVRGLRRAVSVPISIDTYKSTVARAALDAGADIVNDVSALRFDAAMASLLAAEKVPVILMHMQGTPQTMQQSRITTMSCAKCGTFLRRKCYEAMDAGIAAGSDRPRSGHRLWQNSRAQSAIAARPAGARRLGPTAARRRFAQGFYRQDLGAGPDRPSRRQSRGGGCGGFGGRQHRARP